MSGITNVGLNDRVTFGKYKMKTFQEVFNIDPAYLCWLRDEKIHVDQLRFFSLEFLKSLDDAIRGSKELQRQYRTLNLTEYPTSKADQATEKVRVELAAEAEKSQEARLREEVYSDAWGAF